MMPWIKFKGTRSDQIGLQTVRVPDRVSGAPRIDTVQVPGRSGDLHINNGGKNQITLSAIFCPMGTVSTETIKNWLKGSGDLIIFDDPNYCYKATIVDEIQYIRYRPSGLNYDTINAFWSCNPYKFQAVPDVVTITQNATIAGKGDVDAHPKIIVYGSGDVTITINNVTISLYGVESNVTIDADANIAYIGDASSYTAISLDDDAWPVLMHSGQNSVSFTGAITKMDIYPNWRWE